jgi:hypothetical protein
MLAKYIGNSSYATKHIIDDSQSPLALDSAAYLGAYSLCVQHDPYSLNKPGDSKSS